MDAEIIQRIYFCNILFSKKITIRYKSIFLHNKSETRTEKPYYHREVHGSSKFSKKNTFQIHC